MSAQLTSMVAGELCAGVGIIEVWEHAGDSPALIAGFGYQASMLRTSRAMPSALPKCGPKRIFT